MKIAHALAVTLLFGCAKSAEPSSFNAEAGAPTAPAPGPTGAFTDAGGDGLPTVDCAEATKLIYVVATDKGMYRFDPSALTFTRIGTLGCPTDAGTFSMAIDRRGIAWVEFTDGRIYAVDTRDATCQATPFEPNQSGFNLFGMGYARNGDTPTGETLYLAGPGLASLDTTTFNLNFLGSLTLGRSELTSMDTQLFAFSPESGVIDGLDKTSAATTVQYRTSAILADAGFAFAQWGGDFWIFTGDTTTQVTRYTPATNTSTVPIANTGMLIVGAGSSTCAPIAPH